MEHFWNLPVRLCIVHKEIHGYIYILYICRLLCKGILKCKIFWYMYIHALDTVLKPLLDVGSLWFWNVDCVYRIVRTVSELACICSRTVLAKGGLCSMAIDTGVKQIDWWMHGWISKCINASKARWTNREVHKYIGTTNNTYVYESICK